MLWFPHPNLSSQVNSPKLSKRRIRTLQPSVVLMLVLELSLAISVFSAIFLFCIVIVQEMMTPWINRSGYTILCASFYSLLCFFIWEHDIYNFSLFLLFLQFLLCHSASPSQFHGLFHLIIIITYIFKYTNVICWDDLVLLMCMKVKTCNMTTPTDITLCMRILSKGIIPQELHIIDCWRREH